MTVATLRYTALYARHMGIKILLYAPRVMRYYNTCLFVCINTKTNVDSLLFYYYFNIVTPPPHVHNNIRGRGTKRFGEWYSGCWWSVFDQSSANESEMTHGVWYYDCFNAYNKCLFFFLSNFPKFPRANFSVPGNPDSELLNSFLENILEIKKLY